jgi:hypothetical protein
MLEGGFVLPFGTVTLLLGDVEGSTWAWERDPEHTATAVGDLNELVNELGPRDGAFRRAPSWQSGHSLSRPP